MIDELFVVIAVNSLSWINQFNKFEDLWNCFDHRGMTSNLRHNQSSWMWAISVKFNVILFIKSWILDQQHHRFLTTQLKVFLSSSSLFDYSVLEFYSPKKKRQHTFLNKTCELAVCFSSTADHEARACKRTLSRSPRSRSGAVKICFFASQW